jgi:hypothetical protein
MGAQQGKSAPGFEVGPPPSKSISRIKGLKPRQAPRSPVISQGPMSIMGPTATTLNYFSEHTGKKILNYYCLSNFNTNYIVLLSWHSVAKLSELSPGEER